MLSKTELKILKILLDDLTKVWTIREISLSLILPYPQVHRSVKSLIKKDLIIKKRKGKSSLIELNLEFQNEDYLIVESERKKEIKDKYKVINIIEKDLSRLKYNQFICILFGSYAVKKAKKDSDIDLLFVIPEQFNYADFEQELKNNLLIDKIDINITTEKGLVKMWYNPSKLNVGNEILKKHIILKGAEAFFNLRREYYLGEKSD